MATLLLLFGCATPESCSQRQFFRAFVGGQTNPNKYFPGVAEIQLHEKVTLGISICANQRPALCVAIYPAEDAIFQFLDTSVTVSSGASNARLAFTKISYELTCTGRTSDDKDAKCRSPKASPLVASSNLDKKRLYATVLYGDVFSIDKYEFAPDAAFKGATVSPQLFVTFRRKYLAMTEPIELSRTEDTLVSLPNARVGDQTLNVPQVTFRYVSESVCVPTNRPLSLQ
jgi:hypothetical protein